jgi:hypothetical protein
MGLLLSAVVCSAEPFEQQCQQQLPPARVQVRATFADPRISFDLTAAQIQPLARVSQPGVSFGLTQTALRVDQKVSLNALVSNLDARICARPDIELTLALYRADIYVARELVGNDCAVAAVWHHELRHFAIDQETLQGVALEVQDLMASHYRDQVLIGPEADIRRRLEDEMETRWAREIEVLQERANAQHVAHDEQDAQNDRTACDGALARIASQLRGGQ